MPRKRFSYNEDTLIDILQRSKDRDFTYQTRNNPEYGAASDPEEQKHLDEGWRIANILFHLDFAEGMGLMKLIHQGTREKPSAKDINGNPIQVSTYRMTYRGIRYLQSSKLRRWVVRNSYEITPWMAAFAIFLALFSLAVSMYCRDNQFPPLDAGTATSQIAYKAM